jgi:hypothetical protein
VCETKVPPVKTFDFWVRKVLHCFLVSLGGRTLRQPVPRLAPRYHTHCGSLHRFSAIPAREHLVHVCMEIVEPSLLFSLSRRSDKATFAESDQGAQVTSELHCFLVLPEGRTYSL